MKLLSHWGKSKSCSAAVLRAALCCIALETCLIGMCGPNSPHCLKLAGFMFTTIGFGIAALDCLCFSVCMRECVWQPECKANPSVFSAYHIRMHDSCNCFKSIVVNRVNHVFLKVVGGSGLWEKKNEARIWAEQLVAASIWQTIFLPFSSVYALAVHQKVQKKN